MTTAHASTPAPVEIVCSDDYSYLPQGARVHAALDPEKRVVYTYLDAHPFAVWHRRHIGLCSWSAATVGESIQAWLEAHRGQLTEVADGHLGTEWDGSNHVGRWTDEAREVVDQLSLELDDEREQLDTYWDAGEYLAGDRSGAIEAALEAESLEAWADHEAEMARGNGAHIHARDAVAWVVDQLGAIEEDDDRYQDAQRVLAREEG